MNYDNIIIHKPLNLLKLLSQIVLLFEFIIEYCSLFSLIQCVHVHVEMFNNKIILQINVVLTSELPTYNCHKAHIYQLIRIYEITTDYIRDSIENKTS